MALFDLFSKRQKRQRGEIPDVYQYAEIPKELRVQVVHIVTDALGRDSYTRQDTSNAYTFLHDTLAREYGLFTLTNDHENPPRLFNFLLNVDDHEKVLDVIELCFRYIERVASDEAYRYHSSPKVTAVAAIDELNSRFREHGVGYQFHSGELIRVDSELVHSAVVRPTLMLLRDKPYQGANEEFLRAHEHYRHGRYEESLAESLKALESTLKAICQKRRWSYSETDTSKRLLDTVFTNGLIPPYLQAEFTALRASLEAGVPTVRNRQSGHGRGTQPRRVPQHLAAYLIHLSASSILFLVESEATLG